MADGVKIKGKTFGQKKPPLSVTISGILDKYPDGQIFKVCIPFRPLAANSHSVHYELTLVTVVLE